MRRNYGAVGLAAVVLLLVGGSDSAGATTKLARVGTACKAVAGTLFNGNLR